MLDRLFALNAANRPGLSERDFKNLFAKCRCGLVMTRRVFERHACVEVIDLVGSDDSDGSSGSSSPTPVVVDLTGDSITV